MKKRGPVFQLATTQSSLFLLHVSMIDYFVCFVLMILFLLLCGVQLQWGTMFLV
jgi:hypothetical protein